MPPYPTRYRDRVSMRRRTAEKHVYRQRRAGDNNSFSSKYNQNAVSQKLSKRPFHGTVKKKSKFEKKVLNVIHNEGDWTRPVKVRQFGPLQLTTAKEIVSYGMITRAADYPSATIIKNKFRSNWTIMSENETSGLTELVTIDPLDVSGQDISFKMGDKWRFKLKNNSTAGCELTFYLVKSKCENPTTYDFLHEIEAGYQAKYLTGSEVTTDVWVSPGNGIFPKNFKRSHQIVWKTTMSMETGQECLVNVPYYELIYNHDSWARQVGRDNNAIMKDSYLIYYRLEGKIASGTTAESSQFVEARGLPADRAASSDQKRVGTNSCEIDIMWDFTQSYSYSHKSRNATLDNQVVNYDDDATISAGVVEANYQNVTI